MVRRAMLGLAAVAAICGASASAALAAAPITLVLNEADALAVLGHDCGGIKQQVYATGFAGNGYPTGGVSMSTTCAGSGRGGHPTTYTGTASVVWTWFGETRSFGPLTGSLEAHAESDAYGDRVYNEGTVAHLEDGDPPLEAPAAPIEVQARVAPFEEGSVEGLRMSVGWTPAAETLPLLRSSTVTATPVSSAAPVLTATVSSDYEARLQPVQPDTTYEVTVTNADAEGTSPPSTAVIVKSPNADGEEDSGVETCEYASGMLKLAPGLTNAAKIQTIIVKGEFAHCDGPLAISSGRFTDHLRSTTPLTCSVLTSALSSPNTSSVSLALAWSPATAGSSRGTLPIPLAEGSLGGVSGTLEGGPFSDAATVSAHSISEAFDEAQTCGQAAGKKPKPVKEGVFATGTVEFG